MLESYKKQFLRDGEVYLRVKARPSASRTMVKQVLADEEGEIIKIDVAAPAVKNKANLALINFLAKEFAIRRESVKIIGGAGDRFKLVKIVK